LSDEFYISLIGEAFDGYSQFYLKNEPVYVKHVTIRDQRYLHKYYEKYKKIALDKGLDSEEDRVAYVLKEDIWSEEDEMKISSLEKEVQNLKATAKAIFLTSQKETILKEAEKRQKELEDLKIKRHEVIGKTAEDYATSRSGDELLRFLLFKDEELKENLYTAEEFDELETWEVIKINSLQKEVQEKLNDSTIQEAVLKPSFSMYLSLCENAGDFYRKPITELTIYQLRVVLYGRMFHNIFQYTDNIPDHIRDDPKKLIDFSEAQRNKDSHRGGLKDDADTSAVFGATEEDMKQIREEQKAGKAVSLTEEAKKHGGKLNMEQMMRLAGHDV
jgi:hypothetical protein